jgi:hypothetical protein
MAKELAQNSFNGTLFEYRKHSGEIVVQAISFGDKALGGAPPVGAPGALGKIRGIKILYSGLL